MVRVDPGGVELDGDQRTNGAVSGAVSSAETPITSGGDARSFIARTVTRWDITHIGRQAVMVGHELAANALRHGSPPVRLRLRLGAKSLVIEVSDGSDETPQLVEIDNTTSPSGRGMRIVASLASDWGVRRHASGKTVWAALAA
jgi:hypothetical protein